MTKALADRGHSFKSTKTYHFSAGFSCAFRQWRAEDSHCRFLHGYPFKFHFVFEADELDDRNWVVNFGGLKPVKAWLESNFDHTTLVASDDPQISMFRELHTAGVIDMRVVPNTGCEAIAQMVFHWLREWLNTENPKATLLEVQVHEHDGNSASYGIKRVTRGEVQDISRRAVDKYDNSRARTGLR